MSFLVKEPIKFAKVREIAESNSSDLVKAVVDIELDLMAMGSEMHVDDEQVLLAQGSKQENLWGINLYPDLPRDEWLEFDSMINVRPLQNNRSRGVESETIQAKIVEIVNKLIVD